MIEETGDNTVNYTDPEARKSPSKEDVMQPGYNEQIVVDNKNGIVIAVDVTMQGNDQKQLKPMIEKVEDNLQKALGLTDEQLREILEDTDVLADNGYFSYEGVNYMENKEGMTLIMPDKRRATEDKDKLQRLSQCSTDKTRGY